MALLKPSGGKTWCKIVACSFPKTYDGDINTGCAFRGDMSCMSEWSWEIPVTVNAINIHSKNYHKDNYIYGVWGYSNGSWIEIWSGKLYLPSDSWHSLDVELCPNCTAIWLMQSHARDVAIPRINEIDISYEPLSEEVMNFVKQHDGSYAVSGDSSGKVIGDVVCSDYITESTCLAACCYWYDGECHPEPEESPVKCEFHLTEIDCLAGGCYWYDGACYTEPAEEAGLPWLAILAVCLAAIALIGTVIGRKS